MITPADQVTAYGLVLAAIIFLGLCFAALGLYWVERGR